MCLCILLYSGFLFNVSSFMYLTPFAKTVPQSTVRTVSFYARQKIEMTAHSFIFQTSCCCLCRFKAQWHGQKTLSTDKNTSFLTNFGLSGIRTRDPQIGSWTHQALGCSPSIFKPFISSSWAGLTSVSRGFWNWLICRLKKKLLLTGKARNCTFWITKKAKFVCIGCN